MFIQRKIVTILLLVVHGCIAVVAENENCNRVQFTLEDQTGNSIIQNFTKQSIVKNGKSVYYSVFGLKEQWRHSVIWWSNTTNKWVSQIGHRNRDLISNKITKAKQNFPPKRTYSSISQIIVSNEQTCFSCLLKIV